MRIVVVIVCLLLSFPAFSGVSFTGNARNDFPDLSCYSDLSSPDVGLPPVFAGTVSGFDIESVCLYYDRAQDIYFIGIRTFNDTSGFPIIFGDVDGDGDPSRTGNLLNNLRGTDQADLGGREFFTWVFDFDNDHAPDLVAGVHTTTDLNGFQVVGGVAAPDNDLLFAPFARFYGNSLTGVSTSLFGFPDRGHPHLEFALSGISNVSGFSSIDLTDPNDAFQLYVTTGSFDTGGSLADYFVSPAQFHRLTSEDLLDNDGDLIPNAPDTDDDNDSISDLREKNLDIDDPSAEINPDTDGDGVPDYLDTDSDGDKIPDSVEKDVDVDGDGVPSFRDEDSDADGISDDDEDTNDNGLVDSTESNPTKVDTDGDGLCDGNLVLGDCTSTEMEKKTKPYLADSDGDGLCDGVLLTGTCKGAEGILGTDPNKPDEDPSGILSFGGAARLQGSGISCNYIADRKLQIADYDNFFFLFLLMILRLFLSLRGVRRNVIPAPCRSTGQAPAGIHHYLKSLDPGFRRGDKKALFQPGLAMTLCLFISFFSFSAHALNIQRFRPAIDEKGMLQINRTEGLAPKEYSVGMFQNLSHNPLELGRATGSRLDSVVSWSSGWDLWGAIGVLPSLEVGANIPFSLYSEIEDLASAASRTAVSMGDVELRGKWRFLTPESNSAKLGMALIGFFSIPTGDSRDFYGDKGISGGGLWVADRAFGLHEIALQMGAQIREDETITALGVNLLNAKDELRFGAGWRWHFLPEKKWSLLSELNGASAFQGEPNNLLEYTLAVQKGWGDWSATLGAGTGLTKGYGAPDMRLVLGVTLSRF